MAMATRAGTTLSPAEFAVLKLRIPLYDWQIQMLEAFGAEIPTAVAVCNGGGKTAQIFAPAILWFLARFPRGQFIVTSGSARQLELQLYPSLTRFQRLFPEWVFLAGRGLRTPEGGFCTLFSTDQPGRAEGWHPKVDSTTDPVAIGVDEAKSVPESIFQAFDRCTRRFQLWGSSPGAPEGQFYRAFHEESSLYYSYQIASHDCPHISSDKRDRDLIKYGIEHPVYRSMHLAEFTEDSGMVILKPSDLKAALARPCRERPGGEQVAFCDFAAGGAENTLTVRRGNVVRLIAAWTEVDTMQAARQFVQLFLKHGLRSGEVWGDADGLGGPICDAIDELGEKSQARYRICRFHGGAAVSDEEAEGNYLNAAAECWFTGSREIARGRINLGDLDSDSFRQLTTRKAEWTDRGKLRNESKEKMASRGVKSPDRGDGIMGAIYCGAKRHGAVSAAEAQQAGHQRNEFASVPERF